MDKVQKTKIQNQVRRSNVLESLKDLGAGVTNSVKEDIFKGVSGDFLDQIFGKKTDKKVSGEIHPGESLEFNDLLSGQYQENLKLRQQISLERKLAEEDKSRSIQKSNELRVQLQALMQEVLSLAKSTQNLGEDIEVAAMQAPAQPGIYHIIFFEKLLTFIQNFRAKIDSAGVWLTSCNKRAQKKNYWAMYKQKGSSFLLSPEHYSQRSAG